MRNFTKCLWSLMICLPLLLVTIHVNGQQFRTIESGNYISALAKDNQGNIFAAKFNAGTDKYDVYKININSGTSTVIYTGLQHSSVDFPWGMATDSHGNLFIAASNVDNKVIKLTYNSGTNTYTPADFMAGNFVTTLAIDNDDNLYLSEYNAASNKYRIVRYPAGANTGGTVLYDNINISSGYTNCTSIVVAPNHDIYFNLPFGSSATPDQGKVLKLSAADSYSSATALSSGKYSTSIGLDELGNLYVSEYEAGQTSFVLNKYTGATGTPSTLYTLDDEATFHPWGILVLNSQNIYFATGSSTSNPGGALVQLYSEPITAATNIIPSEQTATGVKLSWTNGSGVSRAVFMAEANTGIPSITNNTTYTSNATFGSGTADGTGNWFCVYNGTGNSEVVTGLEADHIYRVMVLEYNGAAGLQQYQTATATGNPVNISAATITSIARADPDNTFENDLHYTVTFGSPVAGLTTTNFNLTTTGYVSGASVTSVTQTNGTTYDVLVTRSGGSGELTLNLVAASGLEPAVVSVLPFAGQTYHLKTTEVDLASLVIGEGTLTPAFSADVINYTATVHNSTLFITPTAVNSTSSIVINGMNVASGVTFGVTTLTVGSNTITIVVTSGSSALSKTYTLSIDYELPLPVTWQDFSIAAESDRYTWHWKLGVESQVSHYVPQYSLDGIHYKDAGKVTEKNSDHSYQYTEEVKAMGLIYFRVMAVDNDGSQSYSGIKTLNSASTANDLILYPNPVMSNLRIKWPNRNATTLQVAVYNMAGKQVLQRNLSNAEVVTLPVNSLATGVYFLVVKDNLDHQLKSGKFLKK